MEFNTSSGCDGPRGLCDGMISCTSDGPSIGTTRVLKISKGGCVRGPCGGGVPAILREA